MDEAPDRDAGGLSSDEQTLLKEGEELEDVPRAEPAMLDAKSRSKNFAEVERPLSVEQAIREARRCLRCDLEFTQRSENEGAECAAVEGKSA